MIAFDADIHDLRIAASCLVHAAKLVTQFLTQRELFRLVHVQYGDRRLTGGPQPDDLDTL